MLFMPIFKAPNSSTMKLIFTLIAIFFCYLLNAQPGSLNKKFGDSGKVLTVLKNAVAECYASAIQSDDKIVTVGEYSDTENVFLVLRYLPNGTLDSSFGNNGMTLINFGYDLQIATAIAIQKDGKIVVTGYGVSGFFDFNYDIPIARLNTDGSLDSSFGNNGKMIADLSDGDFANSICIQDDGKIVVGGYYDNVDFLLIRYNANGSLDNTFGDKGKVITMFSGISTISSIAIQPDGKIVAGGVTDAGESNFGIARYNSNGTLDSTFGINGFVTTDYNGGYDAIRKIIIQPDKKIIAVGSTNLSIAVARYNSNGTLDNTFGKNGKCTLKYAGNYAVGYNAVLQNDGKLVITGPLSSNTGEDYLLVRLKNDGSVDSSFGTNGSVITDFSGLDDEPWGIGINSDNTIIAAGLSQRGDPIYIYDVSLAAYNEFGKIQSTVIKIRRWLQQHNGIEWDNVNGISRYVVQRSNDVVHFNSIAKINAGSISNYTYQDQKQLSGINYYRVQTTSADGTVAYSNIVAMVNDDGIKLSPNPATNILHIEGLSSSGNIKMKVVDLAGNIAISEQLPVNSNSYNLNISSLHAGNYLLKIEMTGKIITKQFLKQ